MGMEIKEETVYFVGNREFETREKAQKYLDKYKATKAIFDKYKVTEESPMYINFPRLLEDRFYSRFDKPTIADTGFEMYYMETEDELNEFFKAMVADSTINVKYISNLKANGITAPTIMMYNRFYHRGKPVYTLIDIYDSIKSQIEEFNTFNIRTELESRGIKIDYEILENTEEKELSPEEMRELLRTSINNKGTNN